MSRPIDYAQEELKSVKSESKIKILRNLQQSASACVNFLDLSMSMKEVHCSLNIKLGYGTIISLQVDIAYNHIEIESRVEVRKRNR